MICVFCDGDTASVCLRDWSCVLMGICVCLSFCNKPCVIRNIIVSFFPLPFFFIDSCPTF